MSRRRTASARVAVAAAATALAALAAPSAAQASHPSQVQPFLADSGDACARGSTEGTLTWHANHPPERPAVGVRGRVTDGSLVCPGLEDDGRYTVATFTAYAGNLPVDAERRTADNETLDIAFDLTFEDASSLPPNAIDAVGVQVCRFSGDPGSGADNQPDYCGITQVYRP